MTASFQLDALSVDRNSPVSLQRQLYLQLREMIVERFVEPDSRLPSSRSLALDLGMARNTILTVYEQLATEGYVSGGRGARLKVVDFHSRPAAAPRPLKATHRRVSARGAQMYAQPFHLGMEGRAAFHPGMPDAENFPFIKWSRLLARRARTANHELFGSHDITGYRPLKEAIASYVKAARGVRCTPEQIVITTGAQSALDLLARLLLNDGDCAWVEEPGYYGAQAAFSAAGAKLEPLHVAKDGWRLDRLPKRKPSLIYVTPACQHPLGITMRMEQRLQLLELAERFDAYIVEDDFDGEYRFQGRPIPAIQGTDRADRVIYLGTFSKLLFPALRIGFLVLPESLAAGIVVPLGISGHFAPPLLQAALADFIEQGHMSRHLRRMRRIYATRRQAFRDLAAAKLGEWIDIEPGDAGIQIVVSLKDGLDDRLVASAAGERHINLSPLSMHYRHGKPRSGLVMGYAALDEKATKQGLSTLRDVFRSGAGKVSPKRNSGLRKRAAR